MPINYRTVIENALGNISVAIVGFKDLENELKGLEVYYPFVSYAVRKLKESEAQLQATVDRMDERKKRR